jgi:hypothetical protein
MPAQRFAPYAPAIAAVVEIPWLVVVGLAMWMAVGDSPQPGHEPNLTLWSLIGVIPAVLGVLAAIAGAVLRWPQGRGSWIWLVLGGLVCLAMTLQWGSPNGIIE